MSISSVNRKDEIILTALLSNPTVRAASKACGVSETQIYARLRKPAFKEKYDRARREMLEQSTAYVQGMLGDAFKKMRALMDDPDAPHQVQLNAAEALARNAAKYTDTTDIQAQIAELRKAVFPDE